jgi:hypothetical protein
MLLRGIRDRGCALRAPVAAGAAAPDADAAAAAAALAVSEKADGFDAKDLQAVLDRAVHFALRRQLAGGGGSGLRGSTVSPAVVKHGGGGDGDDLGAGTNVGAAGGQQQHLVQEGPQQHQQQREQQQEEEEQGGLVLTPADLESALEGFVPAAFRGVGRTGGGARGGVASGGAPEGWQDVGGLAEAKAALTEALELPIKWVSNFPLYIVTWDNRHAGPARGCLCCGLLPASRLTCTPAWIFTPAAPPSHALLAAPAAGLPPGQVAPPRVARAAAAAHGSAAVRPARLRQDAGGQGRCQRERRQLHQHQGGCMGAATSLSCARAGHSPS